MELGKKLVERFQTYPPVIKAFFIILLLMLVLVPICRTIGLENKEASEAMEYFYEQEDAWTIIKHTVIIAPILEEIFRRGPAWLLLITLLFVTKLAKSYGLPKEKLVHEKILLSINKKPVKVLHLVFWLAIILPNAFWAMNHGQMIPTFLTGLVFGWLLLKTRSLLKVILAHMLWNAYATIGVFVRSFF